jgi:nucleoside-diphosphate-sugar epimerase
MGDALPSIVVTGISGNLGQRLLPMLSGFRVVGVDFRPPQTERPHRFVEMDLGQEASCLQLLQLLREVRPVAVVHLAFVLDAVRTGILDRDRIWQINVAGTARVMEAIAEANREWPMVEKFIFLSSVSAYGPNLSTPATEETPLAAHTYVYGIHKMEADRVVQQRGAALRGCSVYILRPHILAGASVNNYFMEAFRGIPGGPSKRASRMREQGQRLPCMLPSGNKYLENRIQFVHVDDVARLIGHILWKTEPEPQRLTILNVAGRGGPMTYAQCIGVAKSKLVRVPTETLFKLVLEFLWRVKISTIPPDVAPYMTSETMMDTSRLAEFLGVEYRNVVRYPIVEAFAECFQKETAAAAKTESPLPRH